MMIQQQDNFPFLKENSPKILNFVVSNSCLNNETFYIGISHVLHPCCFVIYR